MLSHELRNPLAPIVTAAQVLDKVAPNDSRIAWVREVIERQVTHLARARRRSARRVAHHAGQDHAAPRGRRARQGASSTALEIVRPLIDSKRHALSVARARHAGLGVRRLLALEPDLQQRAAQRRQVHDRRRQHRASRPASSAAASAFACATTASASSRSSCRTSSRCSRKAIAGSTAARAGSVSASPSCGASSSCIRGRST